ncbi:hypothetical protein CARUB_v10007901mg [Capsella rubella]|uniref:Uncharacterized protein n=1 Tax=Capsella rubella TaxID=81985 RepID=R0G750_9BRAS|nr:hypothetical protein CARUB_v10007901mg [Capsella rubella]
MHQVAEPLDRMSIEVFNVDTKLLATTPLEKSGPVERKTYSIMEIPTRFIGEMDNKIVNPICHKGSEPNFTLPTSEVETGKEPAYCSKGSHKGERLAT